MYLYAPKIVSHDSVKKIIKNKKINEILHPALPQKIAVTFIFEANQVLYYKIETAEQVYLLHVGLEPVTPKAKQSTLRQSYDFFKKNPGHLTLSIQNLFHQINLDKKNAYPFFFSEFPKGYKSYLPILQSPETLEKLAEVVTKHHVAIRLDNKTVLMNPETKDLKLLQVKAISNKDEKKLFEAVFIDLLGSTKEPTRHSIDFLMRGAKRALLKHQWSNDTLESFEDSLEFAHADYPFKNELLSLIQAEIFDNLMSDDDVYINEEILEDEISDKKLQEKEKTEIKN